MSNRFRATYELAVIVSTDGQQFRWQFINQAGDRPQNRNIAMGDSGSCGFGRRKILIDKRNYATEAKLVCSSLGEANEWMQATSYAPPKRFARKWGNRPRD